MYIETQDQSDTTSVTCSTLVQNRHASDIPHLLYVEQLSAGKIVDCFLCNEGSENYNTLKKQKLHKLFPLSNTQEKRIQNIVFSRSE